MDVDFGHVVVIVGYDPVKGFKIKSSDENSGTIEWIPLSRMTWNQAVVTETKYQAVQFGTATTGWKDNQQLVEKALSSAHQKETGEVLATDFTQRKDIFLLNDFGFVLKFKKTCQCQGDTCKHTLNYDKGANLNEVKFVLN